MDLRTAKEGANEILHGSGLQYLFSTHFKKSLDEYKHQLLTNCELKEGERRAYIMARTLILEGFSDLYAKAEIHLPIWLEQELK